MPNNTTLLAAAACITAIALVIRRRQKPQATTTAARLFIGSCSRAARVLEKPQPWRDYQDSSQERGFRVYTVPEMATLLFTNGVAFSDLDKGALAMQQAVLKGQTTLEEGFGKLRPLRAPAGFMLIGALTGSSTFPMIYGGKWPTTRPRIV